MDQSDSKWWDRISLSVTSMQKLPGKDDVAEKGEDENVGLRAQGVDDG